MPSVPRTTNEALSRCPNDTDTLAVRWQRDLRLRAFNEQSALERDSIRFGSPKRLASVPPREMSEYRSLQHEVNAERDSLVARLQRLTQRTTDSLLAAVRHIGELLDYEIVGCPKVGPKGVFDSVCVEAAESRAAARRRDACNAVLAAVNAEWDAMLKSLRTSLVNREERIIALDSATKHVPLKLQLKRLRLQLWQTLAPILTTLDEVSRLVTQFSR